MSPLVEDYISSILQVNEMRLLYVTLSWVDWLYNVFDFLDKVFWLCTDRLTAEFGHTKAVCELYSLD